MAALAAAARKRTTAVNFMLIKMYFESIKIVGRATFNERLVAIERDVCFLESLVPSVGRPRFFYSFGVVPEPANAARRINNIAVLFRVILKFETAKPLFKWSRGPYGSTPSLFRGTRQRALTLVMAFGLSGLDCWAMMRI